MAEKKIHPASPKYDALKLLLSSQGRDADEELIRQIEALYRNDTQEDSESQSLTEPEFPKGSFAVYRFKGDGNDFCFTSSDVLTLYNSALICLGAKQAGDINRLTFDSLAFRYYGEDGINIINDALFSVLAQALPNDDRITTVVEYDFDQYCIRVYGKDSTAEYDLGDLMDAVTHAEAERGSERQKCLEQLLRKEQSVEVDARKPQTIESDPVRAYLTARLVFCKAASNVLKTELCYADGIYADLLIDSLYYEETTLSKLLRRFPASGQENATPYVQELLTEYSDLLWADEYLKHYGWEYHSVFRAVSEALESKDLRDHAIQITKELEQAEAEEPEAEPTEEGADFELSM